MRKKGENDEGEGGGRGAGGGVPPRLGEKKKDLNPTSDASTESEASKCSQSGLLVENSKSAHM